MIDFENGARLTGSFLAMAALVLLFGCATSTTPSKPAEAYVIKHEGSTLKAPAGLPTVMARRQEFGELLLNCYDKSNISGASTPNALILRLVFTDGAPDVELLVARGAVGVRVKTCVEGVVARWKWRDPPANATTRVELMPRDDGDDHESDQDP